MDKVTGRIHAPSNYKQGDQVWAHKNLRGFSHSGWSRHRGNVSHKIVNVADYCCHQRAKAAIREYLRTLWCFAGSMELRPCAPSRQMWHWRNWKWAINTPRSCRWHNSGIDGVYKSLLQNLSVNTSKVTERAN